MLGLVDIATDPKVPIGNEQCYSRKTQPRFLVDFEGKPEGTLAHTHRPTHQHARKQASKFMSTTSFYGREPQ